MQKSNVSELSKLSQAGRKAKPLVKPSADDGKTPEIDFSPVGGKILHRLDPVSPQDGEPSIEEKFRDAGVYGETGGNYTV